MLRKLALVAVVAVLSPALLVALVLLAKWTAQDTHPEVSLPLLAVCGVIVLFVVLGLIAIAFAGFKLADQTQALGLPEGSIRAVLATSLVLLFGILTIFLYGDLAKSGPDNRVQHLTVQQKDKFLSDIPPTQIVSVVSEQPPGSKGAESWTVTYRSSVSAAGADFAKQLLVLIGTLVASVAAFYFGAQTANSAHSAALSAFKATASNPEIRAVTPPKLLVGAKDQDFRIDGAGLNDIVTVKIQNGDHPPISGSPVASGDSIVTCKLTIEPGAPLGPWDVTVSDKAGKEVKASGLLSVIDQRTQTERSSPEGTDRDDTAGPSDPDHAVGANTPPPNGGLASDVLS
jgi:hypothetical protein